MRKKHSPHGNVGPNNREDVHRRCNCCNFLAGVDGKRQMRKDPHDNLGGYICEKCWKLDGENKDFEDQEWFIQDAITASRNTVDGERDYDEMIEDLISDWEKSQDR